MATKSKALEETREGEEAAADGERAEAAGKSNRRSIRVRIQGCHVRDGPMSKHADVIICALSTVMSSGGKVVSLKETKRG